MVSFSITESFSSERKSPVVVMPTSLFSDIFGGEGFGAVFAGDSPEGTFAGDADFVGEVSSSWASGEMEKDSLVSSVLAY